MPQIATHADARARLLAALEGAYPSRFVAQGEWYVLDTETKQPIEIRQVGSRYNGAWAARPTALARGYRGVMISAKEVNVAGLIEQIATAIRQGEQHTAAAAASKLRYERTEALPGMIADLITKRWPDKYWCLRGTDPAYTLKIGALAPGYDRPGVYGAPTPQRQVLFEHGLSDAISCEVYVTHDPATGQIEIRIGAIQIAAQIKTTLWDDAFAELHRLTTQGVTP